MFTLAPVWLAPAAISANLGHPLFINSAAYLTGLNVVGKVRLSDGRLFWKHTFGNGLEKLPQGQMYFTQFDTPVLVGGIVRFPQDSAITPGGDTLVIDDASGIIISPAALKGHKPVCTGSERSC